MRVWLTADESRRRCRPTRSCSSTTGRENLLALEAVLEPLGSTVVDGRLGRGGAARSCSSEDFAVILLDVQMPGMDGFETAG